MSRRTAPRGLQEVRDPQEDRPARAAACDELTTAFRFAHDLYRHPSADQWRWLTSSQTGEIWTRLAASLLLPPDRRLPASAALYESQYIAAFDAGLPHPPVPLLESHYNRRDPVPRILHENVLFYSAFGLRLKKTSEESADHVRHQLEFVAWLYRMEAEMLREGGDEARLDQIRRGRRDYLDRHLMSWLPGAAKKAQGPRPAWVRRHLALTQALVRVARGPTAAAY